MNMLDCYENLAAAHAADLRQEARLEGLRAEARRASRAGRSGRSRRFFSPLHLDPLRYAAGLAHLLTGLHFSD